ncbi:MAG: putative DNA-binding domain-containing protein, partial [Rhodospirillales bacterium]|nr:putative DNA-binding domain-containing protein [Rhodospirillales bacterium]
VYRNNVRGNLTLALKLAFPATLKLVGEDWFCAYAEKFFLAQPPRNADLHLYGETFPAYLAASALAGQLPYLADVAWLDWGVHHALHAAEIPPLDPQTLAHAPESFSFIGHPSLSLLALRRDAQAIWAAVLEEDDDRLAGILPDDSVAPLIILRPRGSLEIIELSPAMFDLALTLASGFPLEPALAVIGEGEAAQALGLLLSYGLFSGITPKATEELPCPPR